MVTIIVSLFLILSALILGSAYFSPIARKIGFRNVRRRLGNTILVVIGSMVGTALISGSLVLRDSLDKTFLVFVDKQIGEIDVVVNVREESLNSNAITAINEAEFADINAALEDMDEVDGVLPMLNFNISPKKLNAEGEPVLNTYQSVVYGADIESVNNFGEEAREYPDFGKENGAFASSSLADDLELKEGDTVEIDVAGRGIKFVVEGIYEDKGLLGGKAMLVDNKFLASEVEFASVVYNSIAVSANGGIEPDNYDGKEFKKQVDETITKFDNDRYSYVSREIKEQALDGYGLKFFITFFIAMSFFGIFAGILLIINLYSMLASERKLEMGILRAIALTRGQLAKTFIYEGYLYSIFSSLLGSVLGLGIGYALVYVMSSIFETLFNATDTAAFEIVFGVKGGSLAFSFIIGALITIFTAAFASYRISKLNIVEAIRNIEVVKKQKLTLKWIIGTVFLGLLFINSFASLVSTFFIADFFESIKSGENPGQFADMTEQQFQDFVNLTEGFQFYVGLVFSVIFGVLLINRIAKLVIKTDVSRITTSTAAIFLISFTGFMGKVSYIRDMLEQDAGLILFFMSGAVLVTSLCLLVTYNLDLITTVVSFVLGRFKFFAAVIKISLRYPSANMGRTGLTLLMFSIIVYLVGFISLNKALGNEQSKEIIEKSLGGYDLIISPGREGGLKATEDMIAKLEAVEDVTEISKIAHVQVILPEYKYSDLAEVPAIGDPTLQPVYKPEDIFVTTYDALPNDYIRKKEIKLQQRAERFQNDEEAWEELITSQDVVILGQYYAISNAMIRPDLKIGQKVKVADIFGANTIEKEVIGIIDTSEASGGSSTGNLIVSENVLNNDFNQQYLNKFYAAEVLVGIDDEADLNEAKKEVRKSIINENISAVIEVSDIAGTSQAFINGINTMLQGFFGFSLLVGISGLAIILVRSVNERRQQIGMLRSLGFQRGMVLSSFFIESTFITLISVLIGMSMSIISMNSLIQSFNNSDLTNLELIIPWQEMIITAVLIYAFSILFSLLPSLKAASLSPVEATNYPE